MSTKTTINNFSINILGADDVYKNGYHYYALNHESEYKIELNNHNKTRCDVEVNIDGERVGSWRINAFSSVIIERPANVNRKFTFLREASYEAKMTGITDGKNENGLISVVFKPEINYDCFASQNEFLSYNGDYDCFASQNEFLSYNGDYDSNINKCSLKNYSSGATVLGNRSNQNFTSTSAFDEYDTSKITTINIRLIAHNYKYTTINISNQNVVPPRYN
jgi:hypothetical protein